MLSRFGYCCVGIKSGRPRANARPALQETRVCRCMANRSSVGKGIVASHRLTPGHLSHMLANGQLLRDMGWNVGFRVPPGLAALVGDGTALPLASSADLSGAGLYVLWAPSLQGLQDVIALRLKSQARVVYVLHEPYTSFRSYREAGFSFLKTF